LILVRLLVWMRLRSLRNSSRSEQLFLVGKVLATVIAWFAAFAVGRAVAARSPVGSGGLAFSHHLWSVSFAAWGAFILLAVPGTLRRAFVDPEAAVLMTQPLAAARRFRILFGDLWLRNALQLVPLVLVTMLPVLRGLSLATGAGWMVLVTLGTGVGLGVLLLVVFSIVLMLANELDRRAAAVLVVVTAVAASAVLPIVGGWFPTGSPWLGAAGLFTLLAIALGPGAEPAGHLYVRAFLNQRGRSGRGRRLRLSARPGLGAAWTRLTLRLPPALGAVLFKDGTIQRRNPLAWLRLGLMALAPLLAVPAHRAFGDQLERVAGGMAFPVIFTLIVLLVAIHESLSAAIAGEGRRMLIAAAVPGGLFKMLRAKMVVWVGGATLAGAGLAAAICLVLGQPPDQLALASVTVALATAGSATLLVLGSAWDLRTDEGSGEDPIERLLREEAPLGPRRMIAFLLLGPAFQGVVVLAMLRLSLPVAVSGLVILDMLLIGISLPVGRRLLERHVRPG
jgi:hypothetical protein